MELTDSDDPSPVRSGVKIGPKAKKPTKQSVTHLSNYDDPIVISSDSDEGVSQPVQPATISELLSRRVQVRDLMKEAIRGTNAQNSCYRPRCTSRL